MLLVWRHRQSQERLPICQSKNRCCRSKGGQRRKKKTRPEDERSMGCACSCDFADGLRELLESFDGTMVQLTPPRLQQRSVKRTTGIGPRCKNRTTGRRRQRRAADIVAEYFLSSRRQPRPHRTQRHRGDAFANSRLFRKDSSHIYLVAHQQRPAVKSGCV